MPQLAVALMLGALLAFYGNELPDRAWSAYAPMLLLFGVYCKTHRLLLFFAAAYLWSCTLLEYDLEHRLNAAFDNRQTLVQGVIQGIPEVGSGRVRFQFAILGIDHYRGRLPRLARLSWYQDSEVPNAGERWQLMVKLKQPRSVLNPAGIDFEAWQFAQGIDAVGYVRESKFNRRLQAANRLQADYWRMLLHSKIDEKCPRCAQKGLLKALAIGFRGDINSHQRDQLQASGTAHLLAISGLHIGLVSLVAFAIARVCWKFVWYRTGVNRQQFASMAAACAALGYAALAGFSLPTVRAFTMLVVVLLAMWCRNRVNLLQSLSVAAAFIVFIDPRSVAMASFWLSFGALLVIALAQFRLPQSLPWWQRLLLLQGCFSLLLAPIGMLLFGQLNPAGLLANIIAIPLISFVVLPILLLACLLLLLDFPGGSILLAVSDQMLGYLLTYLGWLLDTFLASVPAAYFPAPLLILALLAIVWLLLPGPRYLRPVAIFVVVLVICWRPERIESGDFQAVVFDVGMGTSVLLRTRNHSLVYDFGPGKPGGFSAARQALIPSLRENAIAWPDVAVVSHVDQDHSGGMYAFVDRIQAAALLTGSPTELKSRFRLDFEPESCHGHPDWQWDGVQFRFLSTRKLERGNNNRSCVLMVDGRHRLLLPGDIETAQEVRLVAKFGAMLKADVLVAPHHGSRTSSSADLLNRVQPDYVVYTLSRVNRWGFPDPTIQKRYDSVGAQQYRSDLDGAITIQSSRQRLKVSAARRPLKRIWRRW